MAVMQGTVVQKYMNMKNNSDQSPIDITGWELRAELRKQVDSPVALGELTTGNGGLTVVDGPNGRLAFTLDDSLTVTLPVGRVHFDVLRTNAPAGPVWLFGGSFLVKQPVTR